MDGGVGWGVGGSAEDYGGAGIAVYDYLGVAEGCHRLDEPLEVRLSMVRS